MTNSFRAHFTRLLSGTVIAHAVSALSLIVISRIYNEAQFDQLALFIAISGVLGSIFSLRMDLAVFEATSKLASVITVKLGIYFILGFSITFSFIFFIFAEFFIEFFNIELLVLFLIPAASALLALYNLFANYNVSLEETHKVATTKVVRTIGQSIAQISFFSLPLGLVFGELIGRITGIYKLGKTYFLNLKLLNKRNYVLKTELKLRKNYLIFSSFGTLFNTLVLYFPQLVVASFFSVGSAGALLLAQRLIAIPMVFIGQSMSQAYSVEFKKRLNQPQEQLDLFNSLTKKLIVISMLIFSVGAVLAPYIVPIILGEKWDRVGTFITILCPMFAGQIAITPVINTANILGKQKTLFHWDFLRLAFVCFVLLFTLKYQLSISQFLIIFSFGMLILYIILYVYLYFLLKGKSDAVSQQTSS